MLKEAVKRPVTEFEVQADCYQYLKRVYPLVRGEIKLRPDDVRDFKNGRRSFAHRGARFDLVICDTQSKPLFVIEVKRKEKRVNSKQHLYEQLATVPCYTVGSLLECQELVNTLCFLEISG